ncbi:hypothetical protein PABG_11650 [Paracoccidioides brasiliensis Pb03]|nr:hypothetical protein PABG_11650 [Paracoccidioides brasiliensis Pb03]
MAVLHNYPAIATVVLNWKTGIAKEPSLPPVSWDALKRGAVKLKRMQSEDPTCSITCNPLSEYNMGGLHLVRILEFNDNTRWIVEMASKRFPKIGMIVKHENGTYDIDPIPGLGGPFERASRMVGY